MPIVEESIVINRPRQTVFDFATNPDNVPLYNSNLIEFEQTTQGPVGKGTRNRGISKVAGRKIEWTAEITDFQDGSLWKSHSVDAPIEFEIDVHYEDAGDGSTKITWHQESPTFGGFFGKLADPLVIRMYSRDVRANLESLKELVEADM